MPLKVVKRSSFVVSHYSKVIIGRLQTYLVTAIQSCELLTYMELSIWSPRRRRGRWSSHDHNSQWMGTNIHIRSNFICLIVIVRPEFFYAIYSLRYHHCAIDLHDSTVTIENAMCFIISHELKLILDLFEEE